MTATNTVNGGELLMKETEVILRSILYQVLKAGNLKEAQNAVMVMCSKDDIATVKQQIEELDDK